jgi:hypothetical protein
VLSQVSEANPHPSDKDLSPRTPRPGALTTGTTTSGQGNTLSFQVKRESQTTGTDIVDMVLELSGDNKGQLRCPKCGAASPTAMERNP